MSGLQIFISYSRQDEAFARQLVASLREQDIRVWFDILDISAGEKWSDAVQYGLDSCDAMIVIVSPASMTSRNVADEWQYYLDQEKRVVPVLLNPAKMPFQLNRLQYIDFVRQDYGAAFAELATRLKEILPSDQKMRQRADDLLNRQFEDWLTFGQKDHLLLSSDMIEIVLEHSTLPRTEQDRLCYLLLSIAQSSEIAVIIPLLQTRIQTVEVSALAEVFQQVVERGSPKIRVGIIEIIRQLGMPLLAPILINIVEKQNELGLRRAALAALNKLYVNLPPSLARSILENESDWLLKAYALTSHKPGLTTLLLSDGTEFAEEIGHMVENSGSYLIKINTGSNLNWLMDIYSIDYALLSNFDLVVMVRGDHYGSGGNEGLYRVMCDYVLQGGKLLATAWVNWENRQNNLLGDVLPFEYKKLVEDVTVNCVPTDHPFSSELFHGDITYLTSFEYVRVTPEATVLLEDRNGTPIFGYRKAGFGWCYYLNSCQHSCVNIQQSPFKTSLEFKESIQRTIDWILADGSQSAS